MYIQSPPRILPPWIPSHPAFTAANRPVCFASPSRDPVSPNKGSQCTTLQIHDCHTTVFHFDVTHTKIVSSSSDTNYRFTGHIQKQIKIVTGKPIKESATADLRIKQVM